MLVKRTYRQRSTNTLYTSYNPFLQLFLDIYGLAIGVLLVPFGHDLCTLGPGKEVHNVNDTIFVNVPCLQNARRGEILLLRSAGELIGWRNTEIAPLVLIKETAEDGRRVKVRPARVSFMFG
jgi:hypothetical protein